MNQSASRENLQMVHIIFFLSKDDINNMIHLYQDKTAHLLCDESNRQGKFNSNHYVNSYWV